MVKIISRNKESLSVVIAKICSLCLKIGEYDSRFFLTPKKEANMIPSFSSSLENRWVWFLMQYMIWLFIAKNNIKVLK